MSDCFCDLLIDDRVCVNCMEQLTGKEDDAEIQSS